MKNLVFSALLLLVSTTAMAQPHLPMPGSFMPEGVVLYDVAGAPHELDAMLAGMTTVVVGFRGKWCPHCNKHLAALAELASGWAAKGVQILAVSPDSPDFTAGNSQAAAEGMLLLSDGAMVLAQSLGLAFELDAKTRERYKGYNIDLEEASGYDHHLLPVPYVLVVNGERQIEFSYANEDYSKRVPLTVLGAAVEAVFMGAEED